MRASLALLLLALATSAAAQQSPMQTRIEAMIGGLVVQNAQQAVQIEQLQKALADAQAKIKSFEDQAKKPEQPQKPDEPPK